MYKVWKDLIKPKHVIVDKESYSETYGKFRIEPLEKGFGTTLGNSLRRVMLSSLYGAAITIVKVNGVSHEFSSLPGVKEDGIDVILNLKEVRLKAPADFKEEWAKINLTGAGFVQAKHITFSDNRVEILNPEHIIATLDDGAEFNAELLVKMGRGWSPAERNVVEGLDIGYIPIDAVFSPIKKVSFDVTNTRVGQITDFDKLMLEVYTDGSIDPEDSVGIAAKILKDYLDFFIHFDEDVDEEETKEVKQDSDIPEGPDNPNIFKTVDELELPVRASNCLRNANITYIGELIQKTEPEMLSYKNFGRKSLNDIKEVLTDMHLSLGMKVPDWEEKIKKHRVETRKPEE